MNNALSRIYALASTLPGIEQSTSYGTPSLKVQGKFLARLKDDDTLVVRCPLEEKAMLMATEPALFFETDHYKGYPAVLVRLSAADDATLRGRLEQAWRMQASKKLRQSYDQGEVTKKPRGS